MTAYTLLLRLAGPMQSWGTDSRFENRRTEMIPTKSGIIGMLSAALGRKRNEDVSDLAALNIGIRVDRPGTVITDFHTARTGKTSYITTRYYLCDAIFIAGIESDNKEELEKLEDALLHPEYPLFLGRRSCPPEFPLVLGIRNETLKEGLENEPWTGTQGRKPENYHLFLEGSESGMVRSVLDQPVSFDFHHRKHERRLVSEIVTKCKEEGLSDEIQGFATEHDPFSVFGGYEE